MQSGLIERIDRRLRAVGMTARAASLAAGLSDGFVRNIIRGKSGSPRGENLAKIARVLRTTEIWLLRGEGPEEAGLASAPGLPRLPPTGEVAPADVRLPKAMVRDVPVRGTANGAVISRPGEGGQTVEGFVLDPASAVDHVRRPPALTGVADAYAIYVVGDSMAPKHEAGELRFVHPHKPPRPGDPVLVLTTVGDRTEAFIKTYRGRSRSGGVLAEQLNPKALVEFRAATVTAVHRVLTLNELFEV